LIRVKIVLDSTLPQPTNSKPQPAEENFQEGCCGFEGFEELPFQDMLRSILTPENVERFKSWLTPENIELARKHFQEQASYRTPGSLNLEDLARNFFSSFPQGEGAPQAPQTPSSGSPPFNFEEMLRNVFSSFPQGAGIPQGPQSAASPPPSQNPTAPPVNLEDLVRNLFRAFPQGSGPQGASSSQAPRAGSQPFNFEDLARNFFSAFPQGSGQNPQGPAFPQGHPAQGQSAEEQRKQKEEEDIAMRQFFEMGFLNDELNRSVYRANNRNFQTTLNVLAEKWQ
jgi:hypothetical protein